jgi:hypothetical protein
MSAFTNWKRRLHELEARVLRDVREALGIARIGEQVDDDDADIGLCQRQSCEVGADEAGPTGNDPGVHRQT